jgi:septum formation protein
MSSLQLILASSSPRRKKLLSLIGWQFRIIPAKITEVFPADKSPEIAVQILARQKAESVAEGLADSVIIAADTVVMLGNQVLGQPADQKEAAEMLASLSGRTHEVFTGVCLVRVKNRSDFVNRLSFYERTKVTFGTLNNREINQYIKSGSPMDKAGSYGIQDDWGALFVSRIEGDYYNVVGLPLHKLYQNMKIIAPEIINQAYIEST